MDALSPYLGFQQLYSQLSQDEKNMHLLKAVNKGNSALMQILITAGADTRIKSKDGHMTPFLCSVQAGHKECMAILLQNNPASFYDIDENGDNALTLALWYDRKEIFYSLLNVPGQYISPDMLSAALFAAAINDHPVEAQMLINKGASINKQHAKDGTTPIMAAVTFENPEMIQVLLRNKPDLRIKNNLGQNVFDLVKECNNTVIQNIFLKNQQINCFVPTPTPKIYPVLPSCPTFVPPCYQPIITEESLCQDLKELSFFKEIDLTPSAPPLETFVPEVKAVKRPRKSISNESKTSASEEKGIKRPAEGALDETDRKFKKIKISCPSDAEKDKQKSIKKEKKLCKQFSKLSLCDNKKIFIPSAQPIIFILEPRGVKRKAEGDLVQNDKKVKKPKL